MAALLALPLVLALLPGPGPAPADALDQLNAAFRGAYQKARVAQLAGPVVVVNGDQVLFLRDGRTQTEALIRPRGYHRLKAVDHVPLALHLTLAGLGPGPLAPERRTELEGLRHLVAAAQAGLPGEFEVGPVLVRQQRILELCRGLLEDCLTLGRVEPERLATADQELGPLLLANAAVAADLQLSALDRAVSGWRRGLPAADWNRLRVVILGAHMAREGELTWQYFASLLDEAREGGRMIYAENLGTLPEALQLLATHGLDKALSQAMFGNPWRLHRDVMADAAAAWLNEHEPGQAKAD